MSNHPHAHWPQVYGIGHLFKILTFGGVAKTVTLRLNIIGIRLDHPCGKSPMINPAVITLRIVLNRGLPVALFIHQNRFDRLQLIDIWHKGAQLRLYLRKPGFHWLGFVIQVDENKPTEFLRPHRSQTDAFSYLRRDHLGVGATQ